MIPGSLPRSRPLLERLGGLDARVSRRMYIVCGLLLGALKLALDNLVVYRATGHAWSPLGYYVPRLLPHFPDQAPELAQVLLVLQAGGEFRLTALPGRRTRLEGTTHYTLAIFPELYWTPWAELLLHHIHQRVLEHVKHLSEMPAAPLPSPP